MKRSPIKKTAFRTKTQSARSLRNAADKLWSKYVIERAKGVCEKCGRKYPRMHPHHIFTREIYHLRHSIENGVCLCFTCHTGSPRESAHQAPEQFREWLIKTRGNDWLEYMKARAQTTIKPDYNLAILFLKEALKGL